MPHQTQGGPVLGDVAPTHRCRDCDKWYGQEDDELGPCMYKHARHEAKYLTPGGMACDEPEELERRGLAWSRRTSA